jgi:hypothetical protein
MSSWMLTSRAQLRRRTVQGFVREMADRHPELQRVVDFQDMMAIANREGIHVRLDQLPEFQHGRLVRLWNQPFVLLNRRITRAEQTMAGMHELCHFWRDDPGVSSYYSDGETGGKADEFADIFAWLVTSPARVHIKGVREEDF